MRTRPRSLCRVASARVAVSSPAGGLALRLRGHMFRTIVALLLVSPGATLTGCALTSERQSAAGTSIPIEIASTARQPGFAVRRETSMGGRTARGTGRAEFHFVYPHVSRFVAQFEAAGRGCLEAALSRSQLYVHQITAILREEGLPAELAYLPLIESGFKPHAVSRAGAVGLWQLVASTGRRYGLRIDRHVDERRDPLKSTRAAARYLRDLQATFGDWHLSLAAYNSGAHAIARALARRRRGTLWELRQTGHLPAETADFVPKFLAAIRIAEKTFGAEAFDDVTAEPLRYGNAEGQAIYTAGLGVDALLQPDSRLFIHHPSASLRVTPPSSELASARQPE